MRVDWVRLLAIWCWLLPGVAGAEVLVPPAPMREFRAAWVATVGNIDWPSKPGLPVEQQKAELRLILDKAVELRLNAIIFQVRPSCDALYKSDIEPWSEYLTGKMGKAPAPNYDPLKYAVDEAHARGLELHAWFNPYRAGHPNAKSPISSGHVSRKHPSMVRKYGKYLWLDPSDPAVQNYTTRVILDVVKRYDIDGVHLDDYFYPYKEKNARGETLEFPDERNWRAYQKRGGKLDRSEWRRGHVNKLMERLGKEIKAQKKWVKFGISPFGIWRPGHPPQIKGLDAYEQLYADARLWLAKGWVDYLAPQLYWAIAPPEQSYPVLLDWWHGQNEMKRAIFPGSALTRVGNLWKAEEIVRQFQLARKSPTPGYICWNMTSLMKNPDDLQRKLVQSINSVPALVPRFEWIPGAAPAKPDLLVNPTGTDRLVSWKSRGQVFLWVVQTKHGGSWRTEIVPASDNVRRYAKGNMPEVMAVTAVSRLNVASEPVIINLSKNLADSR